jgi:hypothetical protein
MACTGTTTGGSAGSVAGGCLVSTSQATSPSGYTKYPHRVAGASVNITASPQASRDAAARTLAGGRKTSEIAKPRPAATSSATATQWPSIPVLASRCPGSGLAAGVLCLVRPSGNSTVFCTNAGGSASAAGAIAADRPTATSTVSPAKRQADRRASRVASITLMTGTAGHAVAFIAHAIPRAIAALKTPEGRAISARVRNISAITGGSVIPIASGNAITGEATTNKVDSLTWCRHSSQPRCGVAMRNASQIRASETAASQIRGSPSRPLAPSAFGSPNTAITGR